MMLKKFCYSYGSLRMTSWHFAYHNARYHVINWNTHKKLIFEANVCSKDKWLANNKLIAFGNAYSSKTNWFCSSSILRNTVMSTFRGNSQVLLSMKKFADVKGIEVCPWGFNLWGIEWNILRKRKSIHVCS